MTNSPSFSRGYVPYFYQAGLYHFYPIPSSRAPLGPSGDGYARYDFSSHSDPLSPFRGLQTVEQVIQRGYFAVPRAEPETALISDKKETSWLGLEDTIWQMRQRHHVYERNMYEIEPGKVSAINSLLTMEAERGSVPADSRELYSLSKLLQGFYQEQRAERVKLWQDLSRVRQTLPEVAQQHLGAYRKVAILEDDEGDAR
jgi:hypothetical protein